MKPIRLVPLAAFALLVGFLGRGLQLNAAELPSALIGKPAPAFHLARVDDAKSEFSPASMQGKVWLLNVWASWCGPCRQELPALQVLSRSAPIVGLNYKDQAQSSQEWLQRWGNPYAVTALDLLGKVGIDYGVTGVPETYVIDKRGIVRFKHNGPITPELVRDKLAPLIRDLNRG